MSWLGRAIAGIAVCNYRVELPFGHEVSLHYKHFPFKELKVVFGVALCFIRTQ